jgi:uncharacterized membrane protein
MPKLDPLVLHHPAVVAQFNKRASDVQLRIADQITAFAGSMNFVYIHIAIFAVWMTVLERSPWPTLTLIVSLEAIFLSTFVMIGQNRQASFQQTKADTDYSTEHTLLVENTDITRLIHELTQAIHHQLLGTKAPASDDKPS